MFLLLIEIMYYCNRLCIRTFIFKGSNFIEFDIKSRNTVTPVVYRFLPQPKCLVL